jgi:hypothetical protein
MEKCVTKRWYEIARASGVSEGDCGRIEKAFAYAGFRYRSQKDIPVRRLRTSSRPIWYQL